MAPKKKKKIKKIKDNLFMTDEEIETEKQLKKKMEREKLEKELLIKESKAELRKAKLAKQVQDKVDIEEEKLRNTILQKHNSEMKTINEEYLSYLIGKRREKEWESYITCNHRPFPNDPPALNAFLYTWKLMENKLNMKNIKEEIQAILEVLIPSDEYINFTLDLKETTLNN